jgi:hypothetical protein
MNLFSSFTFGRLIKTFIPGFVLLMSLLIILDGYLRAHHGPSAMVYLDLPNSSAVIVSSAVVLCIILGLISNTIVFAGLNDWLVRAPVKKAHPVLFEAKKHVENMISETYIRNIRGRLAGDSACQSAESGENIWIDQAESQIDAEYVILREFDTSKILYIQEQYWYYMELHINLAFSIAVMIPSFLFRDISVHGHMTFDRDLAFIAISIGMIAFLVRMAKSNYLRHSKKILSLFCSFFKEPR